MLAAFYDLFARQGELLTSEAVESALHADPSGEWADFRGRGPITKRQVAVLLEPYGIRPGVIHPRGRRADRGYRRIQFERAFRHFLPGHGREEEKEANLMRSRKRLKSSERRILRTDVRLSRGVFSSDGERSTGGYLGLFETPDLSVRPYATRRPTYVSALPV